MSQERDIERQLARVEAKDRAHQAAIAKRTRSTFVKPTLEELLELENRRPTNTGDKAAEIINRFGSQVRYYQHLQQVILTPEALEHDPITVHRIRQALAARVAARASRTFRK